MTAILAISATSSALRAVVRDPAVRLWIHLDYLGQPGAQCLIDGRPIPGLDPPNGATEALRLVAKLVNSGGLDVIAVAHYLGDARPEHADLIGDALLIGLRDRVTLGPALTAISAARACWPHVPHVACFGTEPDTAAMMDRQARRLLDQPDDPVERMLVDSRGYFERAREQARIEVEEEIARRVSDRVRLH